MPPFACNSPDQLAVTLALEAPNMNAITTPRTSANPLSPALSDPHTETVRVVGARAERLPAIDRVRGLVIALMALDHVRDYFSNQHFSATDLTQTTPLLFMTRWLTHFCAPLFIFLAGTSASLMADRMSRSALRRFLLLRGVWLIVAEFTIVSLVWSFNFQYRMGLVMQVIWAIGVSMCVLSALIALPVRWIAAFAIVLIAGHNLLDDVSPQAFGAWAWLWTLLHVQGPIPVGMVAYPLIPWIGVMAAGYAFGALYKQPALRARACLQLGAASIALFVGLRLLNGYGDPTPWSAQRDALFTFLSFINVSKYPPSLLYLTLTLGLGLWLLHFLERPATRLTGALETLGRVPLFAYVVHLALLHLLAGLVALALGHGTSVLGQLFVFFPESWGFGLGGVYVAWLAVLALLYPLCRWFGALKRRRNDPWLSYL
jgi:uncharacterized membrane protein